MQFGRVQCRKEGALAAPLRQRWLRRKERMAKPKDSPNRTLLRSIRLALVLLPASIPFTSLIPEMIYVIARWALLAEKGHKKATAFRSNFRKRWAKPCTERRLRAHRPAAILPPSFSGQSQTTTVVHGAHLLQTEKLPHVRRTCGSEDSFAYSFEL